jgi:hypothetical protein
MAAPYTTNQAPDRYEMDRAECLAGYAYAVRYCNSHHIDIGRYQMACSRHVTRERNNCTEARPLQREFLFPDSIRLGER